MPINPAKQPDQPIRRHDENRFPNAAFLAKARRFSILALQWALVLTPLVIIWRVVDENRVNTLFLDDWSYVPLYEKAKLGQLTMHDLFGGYLEHRPAVVRMVSIVLTLLSGGNVSWQCVMSLVAVVVTWLNCGWLLRRALGSWERMWMPWALMGWVLFCPVQWQGFLWPTCMLVNFPLMFLTSGLVLLGSTRVPVWARFMGCVFCAWLATYSYTPGLMLWVLLPLTAIFGKGLEDQPNLRRRFVLLWLVPMAAVLFSYFHHLENEVEPVFAYGQGNVDTATHSIEAVLRSPEKGIRFALTLLGAAFARGVLGPRQEVAFWAGVGASVLFLIGVCAWLSSWRRPNLRRNTIPFILVACFGAGVACMVAAGRAWASKDVGGALNNRYACYALTFSAGIIGMFAVLRRRDEAETLPEDSTSRLPFQPWVRSMAAPAGALVCGLLVANWFYGVEMMRVWRYARLRGAVDLHFTPLLGQQQDLGHPGAQIRLAAARAATMDQHGWLKRPQAKTLTLEPFAKKARLDDKLARITGTDRKPDRIEVTGYAMLTMRGRPPDAVLITVSGGPSRAPVIVDVALPDVVPAFLFANTLKDSQFAFDDTRPRRCGQWLGIIKRAHIPKGRSRIQAWALNFEQFTISEIGNGVTVEY